MKTVTNIKYLRVSPKKIRELGSSIIGLNPQEAIDRLLLRGDKRARLMAQAVKSAKSNAVNNLKQNISYLRIKKVEVMKGPFFKRWQPVSRGMAHQIKKRTSHIKIELEEIMKVQPKKKDKKTVINNKVERRNRGTQS